MRVLRPVVCSQAPIVLSREPDRAERCRIGSQPVGHNPARRKAVLLKQFHHEFLCGLCIPSALDEEIQHLTLVVDRPPEPVSTAVDRNHHFIEVPMIARSRPRTADIRRDRRAVRDIWQAIQADRALQRIDEEDGAYLAGPAHRCVADRCTSGVGEITVRLLTDDDGSHSCGGQTRDLLATQGRPPHPRPVQANAAERPFRARDIASAQARSTGARRFS